MQRPAGVGNASIVWQPGHGQCSPCTHWNNCAAAHLAGTRRLDLAADLDTFPQEVFELADTLEVLNSAGNRLTTLPHDPNRLHRLEGGVCLGQPLYRVARGAGRLPLAEMVGFKSCRLVQVPEARCRPACAG